MSMMRLTVDELNFQLQADPLPILEVLRSQVDLSHRTEMGL
jgi:hypothetical protein